MDKTADSPTSSNSEAYTALPSPTIEASLRKVPIYIRDERTRPPLLSSTQLPVLPSKPDGCSEDACYLPGKRRSGTVPDLGATTKLHEAVDNGQSSRHLSLQLLERKGESSSQKVRTTSAPLWLPTNTRPCDRSTTSFPESPVHATTPTPSPRTAKTATALTPRGREASNGSTPPQSYLVPKPAPRTPRPPACDSRDDQTTIEGLRKVMNQLQFSHSQLELKINDMEQTLSGPSQVTLLHNTHTHTRAHAHTHTTET